MKTTSPAPNRRLISRGIDFEIVRTGHQKLLFRDLYVNLLNLPWWAILSLGVVFYVLSNIFFATIYFKMGDDISNARDFADFFFFSVQTMATIGYGRLSPLTLPANILMSIEALTGLIGVARLPGTGSPR